jgi:putative ubiquitin-RnfH superfamily antitoxin RatB of RatAB toxin-antitoxin module
MRVEVVYALPAEQAMVVLEVEEGTSVLEAIERSGLRTRYPRMEIAPGRVGIHGKPVSLDTPLREGDRVEIYRPLLADPKLARRKKAAQGGHPPRR